MTLSYGLVAPGAPQGIDTAELKPGLADPVHDSQRIFRIRGGPSRWDRALKAPCRWTRRPRPPP